MTHEVVLHETPTQRWDFTIADDGRAHVGRVLIHPGGLAYRSTVMASEFAITNKTTGITLDAVPASALVQGF